MQFSVNTQAERADGQPSNSERRGRDPVAALTDSDSLSVGYHHPMTSDLTEKQERSQPNWETDSFGDLEQHKLCQVLS